MMLEMLACRGSLYEFINADEIAKGLAPMHPESQALEASKLMIKRLKELLELNKSFAFETTGSGTNYIKHLKVAKAKGYEIHLTFLWLPNAKAAVERVAQRVRQGGHNIPEEVIKRRYILGLKNLFLYYLPIADTANIMDNASEESSKRLIAKKNRQGLLKIVNTDLWELLEKDRA